MKITPLHHWIAQRIGCSEADFNHTALERYQLDRLNWVIKYSKQHSRFYREIFANLPETIISFDDLSAIPFTSADDLRTNPNRFVCVPQDEVQRILTLPTSSTTGESKRVFFSAADQELTVDFFKVGMSTLVRPGDRVLILLPGIRPGSVGDLLKIGLERLECTAEIYGPVDDEERVLHLIREVNANVLVGAPVHLHRLVRWDEYYKILPKGQIRSLLTSTDTLANTIRSNLQSIWGCEVFDHWGMTETGLGGGVECEAHTGFHLRAADLFIEIINPETGQVLPEGEPGEVVITTLSRIAMPLIRYRTGDLSRLIPSVCACGSFIPRLDRIINRVGAGIQLESGLLTQSMLDEIVFQVKELLDYKADFTKPVLSLEVRAPFESPLSIEKKLLFFLRQNSILQTEIDKGSLIINPSIGRVSNLKDTILIQKRVIKKQH
ncbi:MAG: DVU_1553 family AMP-dependent CoA ligase [Anaerolineaceae bacterium]